ncbi:zinc ribbon domain-containing protein [Dictyobacter vulcani]|uniref:Zinc ribbon domain-containing protein n=1 Tax=Dictyobacter vulcani TaxID=2607529 RepID=A0A5J4KNE8_9CHLR|nr:zinc ribbon domain-containing protein [Dictyobacter vulcani]GER89395.1 zinc ribbon domain-containing protein [Dictyobacter vulcani]
MSDFLSSAKNFVNSAVSRTGWEAQKQMRVRSKQTEIDKLLEQRQQLMDELGQVAMNLYQQGSLSDSQLSRLCASIFELDHDMRTRETQLQEVKNEAYPVDQLGPEPTMNYAPPPSSSNASTSGNPANTNASYVAPTPNAAPDAQTQRCPQCGNPLRPNALYCRSCGAKLR